MSDIKKDDKVRFRQGDEAGTILTGLVTRAPWGREGTTPMVSIETLEDPPRHFVRLITGVVVIGSEAPFTISQETIDEVARVAREWPDGIHTCAELQKLEPGRRACTCGRCPSPGEES